MRTVKVGSRESRLAIVQSGLIINAIRRAHPEIKTELIPMKTTGDRIRDRPLEAIGGKGLFVKELDEALLDGRVDICVHSYKDMPVPGNPELPVIAVFEREDPRDILVLPEGLGGIPEGLPLGTSSPRRRLQMAMLHPERRCEPVRGNIPTRLRKLDAGEYGALVLAAAGIKRLGLWERVNKVFSVEEVIPAACQGMLAIQGRAGEEHPYLEALDNADAHDASMAERAFVEALGAGCTSPVAAFAEVRGGEMLLSGLYADEAGHVHRGKKAGSRAGAAALGRELAEALRRGDHGNG